MITSAVPPTRALRPSDRQSVYASLAGDLFVAAIKFGAAYLTFSSAMLSEGVHSVVDSCTELILLYGLTAASKRPTAKHQLGFGREVFFWNFIVAMLILALGSGVAFLDGVRQIMDPKPIQDAFINYIVLGVALIIELAAWKYAANRANKVRGKQSYYSYVRRRRDPTAFTILFGGAVSVLGLVVTGFGNILSVALADPVFDGIASIVIACILAVTAVVLAGASKSLLIGVPADSEVVDSIRGVAAQDEAVMTVNGAITVHLAPDQLLVALSVAFKADLTTAEIEAKIESMEKRLQATHGEIVALFVKPENPERFLELHKLRYGLA